METSKKKSRSYGIVSSSTDAHLRKMQINVKNESQCSALNTAIFLSDSEPA